LVLLVVGGGSGGGGAGAGMAHFETQASTTTEDEPAQDQSTQDQSSQDESGVADTTPPAATTPTIAACDASLLTDSCLIATTTVEVAWSAAADAAYYAVAKNGVTGATTTALTAAITIPADKTSSLAVVSYDAAGNAATSTAVDVAAVLQPLILNEIGWAGTDTDPSNQWIELKNNTDHDLNLSHIEIARSGGPAIPLSGTLPALPNGSYLVVARNSTQWMGTHTLLSPFAPLSTNTAEQLSLVWNSSTIFDASPAASACATWCAGAFKATLGSNVGGHGDLTTPLSMERKANTDGVLATSWQNTDSYFPWIYSGGAMWGTPGLANSAGFPDAGVYCGSTNNILTNETPPGPSFDPTPGILGCTYLSKFITGNTGGSHRYGGLYEGDVGSSTRLTGHEMGVGLAVSTTDTAPADTPAGTHFFFTIFEERSSPPFHDSDDFYSYFTESASTTLGIAGPPHGNYVVFPFTYQP
jgi:hypothetical protein